MGDYIYLLLLFVTDYVEKVPYSTKYIFKYIGNSTFQFMTLLWQQQAGQNQNSEFSGQ